MGKVLFFGTCMFMVALVFYFPVMHLRHNFLSKVNEQNVTYKGLWRYIEIHAQLRKIYNYTIQKLCEIHRKWRF